MTVTLDFYESLSENQGRVASCKGQISDTDGSRLLFLMKSLHLKTELTTEYLFHEFLFLLVSCIQQGNIVDSKEALINLHHR